MPMIKQASHAIEHMTARERRIQRHLVTTAAPFLTFSAPGMVFPGTTVGSTSSSPGAWPG